MKEVISGVHAEAWAPLGEGSLQGLYYASEDPTKLQQLRRGLPVGGLIDT